MTDLEVDESWNISLASESPGLDRLIRRERIVRPPAGLADGEAYRAWLLKRAVAADAVDETDEERRITQEWKERIATGSTQDLWSEYLKQPHSPERSAADVR